MAKTADQLDPHVQKAIAHFWRTRRGQVAAQRKRGASDQGARAAVTGGSQMDGFVDLLARLIEEAGIANPTIFRERQVELPGFFRATKEWDMLVVVDQQLLVAVEAKSQVGPSFGNNFNNRTEEAIGSAVDLWTAYREGAFCRSPRPWLGYLFLLEDCDRSNAPVGVKEPHFKVFEEFRDASYKKRYELLCRKLLRERHYDGAAFLTSEESRGRNGVYAEPACDLSFRSFATSLTAHVSAFAKMRGGR